MVRQACVKSEEGWMTAPGRHRRRKPITTLLAGLLGAAVASGIASCAGMTAGKPRSAPILASIQLMQRTVQSGKTAHGEVVFENGTSRTKVLMRGCKIDGLYEIGVRASDGYAQGRAFSLVGCLHEQEMVAKPGITAYRFKLPALYTACLQSDVHQPPKDSKDWLPLCLKDSSGERNIMPSLPAGTYTVLFYPADKWDGPHVKPASLVVTNDE
jgi:hypothetical protein